MKKIIVSLLAIAALAACTKTDIIPAESASEEAFVLYAGTPETKTVFDYETYKVTWKSGDALAVYINDELYKFVKDEDQENAFVPDASTPFTPAEGTTYTYRVLYPYSADFTFTMSGGVKTPMYGTATVTGTASPSVTMAQQSAVIKTVVKNVGETDMTVTGIRFESDTDVLGGKHTITDGAATPVSPVQYTYMGSQSISVAAGSQTDVFVQCAPFVTAAGSKLTVTVECGSETFTVVKNYTDSNKATFTAGKVNTTSVEIKHEAASGLSENDVFVDFGPTAAADTKWNVVKSNAAADPVLLKNALGNDSPLSLAITSAFSTTWGGAGSEPGDLTKADIEFPKDVWKDALMISNATTTGVVEISGCPSDAEYTVKVLTIRYNGSRNIRVAKVQIGSESNQVDTGAKSSTDLADNEFVSTFTGVKPDSDGKFTVSVSAVEASRSDVINAYINAMVITRTK